MPKRSVITVTQLFGMLFISRMIVNITYNPLMAGKGEMWDHVLSALISFLLTFLIAAPVYFLHRRRPEMDLIDVAGYHMGRWMIIVAVIYALYYLTICCYTLSLFDAFISNVMSPRVSLWVLSLAFVVTACYGACKGIEALARASGLILIAICAAVVFLVVALIPQIDPLNYPPLLFDGPEQTLNGVLLMISHTSCVPAMALLLPMAKKGNVTRGIVTWNFTIYLTIAVLITMIVGALGDYLKTQIFPIYAATSIAQIGAFKRLDALYSGIWATGLFVKLALFLFLFSMCVERVFGQKYGRIAVLGGGLTVAVISVFIAESRRLSYMIYDKRFLLVFTLLVAVAIPLWILITDKVKTKKEAKTT